MFEKHFQPSLLPAQSSSTKGQVIGSNGTSAYWTSYPDPSITTSVFDDMTWGNEQSYYPAGPFGLVPTGNAGGGIYTPANVTASLAGRWGVIAFGIGTNNNATGCGACYSDYAICYAGQAQTTTLTWAAYVPQAYDATNQYTIEMGFRDMSFQPSQATNGFFIQYKGSTSSNWLGVTANNGSLTTVTSSVSVAASTWYNFKMVITASSCAFYVAAVGGAWQLIGTSTTNLPDSTHNGFLSFAIYRNATFALQRLLHIDWVKLEAQFASAR